MDLTNVALSGDRSARTLLGLDGPRGRALAALITQMKQYYTNALSDDTIQEKLAAVGISREQLETGLNAVTQLEQADSIQEQAKGAARLATSERDSALEQMDAWGNDFAEILRVALKDKEELLTAVGV